MAMETKKIILVISRFLPALVKNCFSNLKKSQGPCGSKISKARVQDISKYRRTEHRFYSIILYI